MSYLSRLASALVAGAVTIASVFGVGATGADAATVSLSQIHSAHAQWLAADHRAGKAGKEAHRMALRFHKVKSHHSSSSARHRARQEAQRAQARYKSGTRVALKTKTHYQSLLRAYRKTHPVRSAPQAPTAPVTSTPSQTPTESSPSTVQSPSVPSTGTVTPATGAFDCSAAKNVAAGDSIASYQLRPVVQKKIVSTSSLGTTFAGIALQQQIATSGNRQYVAYYDAARRLTVAYRTLPNGAWSSTTLSGDDAVANWDSHDSIAIGIDSSGNLHLAANMHATKLRYWRTSVPGDLSTLSRVPVMVNQTLESAVSYPQFLTTAAGVLTFNFRQGNAGNADNYFYAWDSAAQSWHPLGGIPVFDGQGMRSAYDQITRGSDGYYYVSYEWRRTGDVATNSRLSLVRTADFDHWQTVSGAAVTLPLRYDTPGVVVDDIAENSGLFNSQEKVGVDGAGNVAVTYAKYDAAGTEQLNLARWTRATGWVTSTISRWTGRWTISGFNTLSVPVTYNAPSALPDGRTAVSFWCGSVHDTIVVDSATLRPVAEGRLWSNMPPQFWQPVMAYPGVGTNFSYDTNDDPTTATDFYALQWASLGSNNDQPRSVYPTQGSPLTVYHVVG